VEEMGAEALNPSVLPARFDDDDDDNDDDDVFKILIGGCAKKLLI